MFSKFQDPEDFITLKRYKARTRFLIKNSKASSWKSYVPSINTQNNPAIVGRKIKSIKGINRITTINLLSNTSLVTSSVDVDVANILGRLFYSNSSNDMYNPEFLNRYQHKSISINMIDPLEYPQSNFNSPLKINLKTLSKIARAKAPAPM